MGKLVLVVGGCRSGKSAFAQQYVEKLGGEKIYLATCPVVDGEIADRIARHRADRRDRGWRTVEEETALPETLTALAADAAVLVDCLTLWINNLLYHCERDGKTPGEDEAALAAGRLVDACRARAGTTLAVANEVGLGIVPDNAAARRFRDMAGRTNQVVAAAADEVYFMACGLPTRIK